VGKSGHCPLFEPKSLFFQELKSGHEYPGGERGIKKINE